MGKRWLWIVVAVVVVGTVAWALLREPPTQTTAQGSQVLLEPVVKGPFEATVSATGSVRAERTQRLAFRTAGTVADVLVSELDTVSAGQVLARLDDGDARLNLAQAEAALAAAQAQLDRILAGPSEAEARISEAAVEAARAAVQTAEAGLSAAQASQERLLAGASAEELAIAAKRVDEARNVLWGAQAQRDAICGRVGRGAAQADCDQAEASVNRSEVSVQIAELQLQQAQAGPSAQDVASAQAQVNQALGQVASARAQLKRAEAEAERTTQGASEAEVAAARAQVQQAQVGVDMAARRLRDVELVAPADGKVATVDLLVGDAVMAGNPVITLIDAEAYHMMMSIDETEIGRIAVGQPARISLDAFPGTPITGQVTRIGAVGTDVQGIVVFPVRVDINPAEVALRPYMTAAVDIVVMQTEDALLVPNRAVRRDAQGRYVEMLANGQLVRKPVELGASNAEYTVVLGGLEEGDQVIVSRPRDSLLQITLGEMNAD